jgi:N-alpha-acetyltransferase 30
MGFVREKRLHRFYLNGKDAFRLILPVTAPSSLLRRSSSSDTNSSSDDSVGLGGGDGGEEEDDWEDVGRLIRLRRKVTTLRKAKFVPVWEDENAEAVSSR